MNAPEVPPNLVWRRRTLLLVVVALGLFVAGVVRRTPVPVFLAIPLLVAPLAAAIAGPRRTIRSAIRWEATGSGPDVQVDLTLTSDPPALAPDLEIVVAQPPGLKLSGPFETRREADAIRGNLRLTAPEPTIATLVPPSVTWRDPLGVVERPVRVDGRPLLVERYPPELLEMGAVRLEHTLAVPGETPSRFIGSSGEFYGLREAAPGDPLRRVNWRASARAGRLLTNEYLLDRTGDVILLLDARPTGLGAALDGRLLGLSRAAALGITEAFLREKSRVGFAAFGEFLEAIPLGGGRTHRVRLRAAIQSTVRSATGGPAERCAISMRRFFPLGVTTIAFTSLAEEESFDLVHHLRRRGYPVAVVSPSALPVLSGARTMASSDEQLQRRIARLARRAQVARAWRDGPVLDWDEYWSLGGLGDVLRWTGQRRPNR